MERLVLIGTQDFDLNVFNNLTYAEGIKCYIVSDMEVQIRRGDDIIKIEPVNKIINQYDDRAREKIPYENPKILMISYSSKDFVLEVISNNGLPKGLYYDDFEKIVPLDELF